MKRFFLRQEDGFVEWRICEANNKKEQNDAIINNRGRWRILEKRRNQ